jgi:hypothetical protein
MVETLVGETAGGGGGWRLPLVSPRNPYYSYSRIQMENYDLRLGL